MTYTQLTQEQRYQIYALLKMEHSQTKIATVIGVHKSTISREIRRNRGKRGYRPKQAGAQRQPGQGLRGVGQFALTLSSGRLRGLTGEERE